jgi:cell wall-associated NlpC family hydrolase
MKSYIYIAIFIIAGAGIFFSGCAASSAFNRYSKEEKVEVKSKPKTKFAKAQPDTNFRSMKDTLLDSNDSDDDMGEKEAQKAPVYDLQKSLAELQNSSSNPGLGANFANLVESVTMAIIKYKDAQYQYGGSSLDGIDCSGFTMNVYQQAFSVALPRSAREQYQVGDVVEERANLKFGDLVFFNTRRRVRPGHVGIYIGEGKFVHASSSVGVSISSLDDDYYNRKYMGGRHILNVEAKAESK